MGMRRMLPSKVCGGHRTSDVLIYVLLLLLATLTAIEIHEHSHGYELGRRPWRDIEHWGNYTELSGGGEEGEVDSELGALTHGEDPEWTELLKQAGNCQMEEHTEYSGEVVKWGGDHLQPSAASCCAACTRNPQCQVWASAAAAGDADSQGKTEEAERVWCGMMSGCGPERVPLPTGSLGTMGTHRFRECWLKSSDVRSTIAEQGFAHPDVGWISGSVFPERPRVEAEERARLKALRDNPALPLVYLDVSVRGRPIGRIEIVLFQDVAPLAAENFRALCTGEKGVVPAGRQGEGTTYSFKGRSFYRIVDRFIDQSGANTESIYGGAFKDDPGGLAMKHDRRGLLSMVNAGPDSNTSHFSILMVPAPHLDGKYVVFGEVVSGIEVALKINALARGQPGGAAGLEADAIIFDAGEIKR